MKRKHLITQILSMVLGIMVGGFSHGDSNPSTPNPTTLKVTISSNTHGQYHVGDTLTTHLQTNEDGFVFCYYQDAWGKIVRIFPNRFRPDSAVQGNQIVILPAKSSGYKILFDKTGTEQVTCYASHQNIAISDIQPEDLSPLSVNSIDEIGDILRKQNPHLATATLNIVVH
ncbi:hypothetical protein TI05_00600 [Achromatium sp. WMS3]|nr:hypothetical protein TI05_00600 [Achromatium sp. WMS3]